MPEKRDYVSVSKGVHNQKNLQPAEVFVICKNYNTAFKEKHGNVNIGFSKFFSLRAKWCILAGSKITQSVCTCNANQNVVLLVDAMDWHLTYKDLVKKIICNTESNKCIMNHWEFCPGTATLK